MNWFWIILAYASLFISGLAENLRGPLFPDLLSAFSLGHAEGAWFFSCASLSMILGAWGASWLIERRGVMFSLTLWTSFLVIGLLGFSWALSFSSMLFFAVFYGLAAGGSGVTQNLIVLEVSPSAWRSRLQNGLQSCYGASSLLAPGLAMGVTWAGGRWNQAFLIPLGLAVFLLLASATQLRTPFSAPPRQPGSGGRPVLSGREIYWGLVLALYVAIEILVSTRLALFLRRDFAFTPEQGSLWTSIFFIGLFVGRILLSFFEIPLSERVQILLFCGASLILFAAGLAWHPLFLAFTGFTLAGIYPVWMTSLASYFPDHMPRVAAVGVGLSGLVVMMMHTLVGQISERWGLAAGYAVGPVLTGVCALMVLFFPLLSRDEV